MMGNDKKIDTEKRDHLEEVIEQQLIHQAQNGSIEAFEKLILNYESTIYAICLRMLCNEHEARDAAQEVCIKVWKQLKTFQGQSKLSTWIYRIATNQCLDMLRKYKRQEEISLEQESKSSSDAQIMVLADDSASIDRHIEKMAMQDVMSDALSELKEEYRTILVLRDMQGYAYDDIATILHLNNGTVKSRLSRARLALKKVLMQNKEPYKTFFRQMIKREGDQ